MCPIKPRTGARSWAASVQVCVCNREEGVQGQGGGVYATALRLDDHGIHLRVPGRAQQKHRQSGAEHSVSQRGECGFLSICSFLFVCYAFYKYRMSPRAI